MSRPRIAQIGPWPSPWGGISVYVQSLSRYLADQGADVIVLDTQNHELVDESGVHVLPLPSGRDQSLRAARLLAAHRCDVAHLHLIGFPWKAVVPFALACQSVGVTLVVSVHSFRVESQPELNAWQGALLRGAARSLPQIFASGEHVADRLINHGVPKSRVQAVAPFVPPIPAEPLDARLPEHLRQFCSRYQHVVAAGAAALTRTAEGQDLYGFDIFTEVANKVAKVRQDVGFVFQLPRLGDEALFKAAMQQCRSLGERLFVHREPLEEGSDLWAVADVFVRPTRSDGDSVSIRESLSLGTPCLASDVVNRPTGTTLFRSGDSADGAKELLGLLDNLQAAQEVVRAAPQPQGAATVGGTLRSLATETHTLQRARQSITRALWAR